MKYITITFILFILCFSAKAQKGNSGTSTTYILKGKISDASNNQALSFASIAVLRTIANKDSLIAGTTANESGEFIFPNLAKGKLRLKVSFVGYQNFEKVLQLDNDLDAGNIVLQPDAKMLQEVNVTGRKSSVSMSLEKRVFNVAQNLTTVGGTAESLLRNVPSLSIDADGTAKLRSVATTIYINGKPTQLSLSQIPANQIESVEVITNPSAKYDASASSGIVNLVLRKNRQAGYTGTVSAGVGNNSRFDGMINLDLNKGKWNITTLYNINSTKNPLNNYADRTTLNADGTPQSYFNQNTQVSLNNLFQNGRIAVDYSLDNKNTLTLAGTYVAGQFDSQTSQQYQNSDIQHKLTSYGERTTVPHNNYTNSGVEFDWKHSFARKGETLSFTSGYNRNNISNLAEWTTTSLNADGSSQIGYPENDHITGQTTGDQYINQLDYTYPINDSTKWEIGLRSFIYTRDQQYFFNQLDQSSGQYNLLMNYSQNARITETVNAIYALYSRKLKNNISIQAGLRLEQSSLKGLTRFEPSSSFGYDYPSSDGKNLIKAFFPSFAITKKLSEESEIGINLSRKIGRPGWRQIFVGIQSNDRQNVTIGNPALQPEFVNTAELNYDKSWGSTHWLSTFYYIYEDNTIKPFVQPSVDDPSVYVTTFTNVKADIRTGFDNTLTFNITKNLTALANFNAFNVVLQTDTYKRTLWAYNAKVNLTYRFGGNITAQLSTNNDSRTPQLQGYRKAIRSADFAIRKSFWNNTGSISFTVNDIFNSRKQILVYEQPTAYQESMNRREVRFYKLTLQLPLGRSTNLKKKKDIKMIRQEVDFNN